MAVSCYESQRPKPAQRILACVLCQQRKKKCDHKGPCSFCIKANVPCVPSKPAPKRARRRPTQELLDRLARCEELLSRCSCVQNAAEKDSESLAKSPRSESSSSMEYGTSPASEPTEFGSPNG